MKLFLVLFSMVLLACSDVALSSVDSGADSAPVTVTDSSAPDSGDSGEDVSVADSGSDASYRDSDTPIDSSIILEAAADTAPASDDSGFDAADAYVLPLGTYGQVVCAADGTTYTGCDGNGANSPNQEILWTAGTNDPDCAVGNPCICNSASGKLADNVGCVTGAVCYVIISGTQYQGTCQ